jgi:hypothetical protein
MSGSVELNKWFTICNSPCSELTNKVWMDRNLGAAYVAESATDYLATLVCTSGVALVTVIS